MNVKYSGYFNSNSGMAEAARTIVMAFHAAGAAVTTEIVPNVETTKHLGPSYDFCQQQAGINIPYTTKIIHITPDALRRHLETMKYHIAHLFWETTKLPKWWVWEANHSVDEVWTGCEWNRNIFYESGVNIPVWVCPQPVEKFPDDILPFSLDDRPDFLFGSIFQWIERKDPKTLITAFLEEFSGNKNVGLLLKTYKERFTQEETDAIIAEIKQWRKDTGDNPFPKIYLYPHALGNSDMLRVFKTIDCFVSPHRGEGWGLGIANSMSAGIPVISTNLGGIHEHVPQELWYPLDYTFCNVFNMTFVPWYDSDQQWAQANKDTLKKHMREVYTHQEEAQQKAQKAREWVNTHLSPAVVGQKMIKHLEEIT